MDEHHWTQIDVLAPEVTGPICSDQCGSKCCNVITAEHYVPVEMVDYANLSRIGMQKFVTFFTTVETPQLLNVPTGDCIFLEPETRLCSIYEYRPLACRKYPYREAIDEKSDVPDWCILLKRSSEKLKNDRIKVSNQLDDDYQILLDNMDPDVLMEYLQKDRGFKPFDLPNYIYDKKIEENNGLWIISADSPEIIEDLKHLLPRIFNDIDVAEWKIIKLMIYDENIEIKGIIEGIIRMDESIEVPYIDNYPPDREEFDRLINLVSSTKELRDYLFGGAYFETEVHDKMRSICENSEPLNSEYL